MTQQRAAEYLMEGLYGPEIVLNGKLYINFGGCGYLGLHNRAEIIKAGCEAFEKYGIASSLSRHYDVSNDPLLDVEENAAKFFGSEDALYLPTGYLTTMVGMWGLADRVDAIFVDNTSHYSVNDAAKISGKPMYLFAHCDAEDLAEKIKTELKAGEKPLIVSDGVFPTFGEIAPVDEYLKLAEEYDGLILLDEAHSVGAVGKNGWGSADHYNLVSDRIYFGGTLSKSFGAHGGIIPGTKKHIDILRQSPTVRGASTGANPCAAAGAKSLDYCIRHPQLREQLWENVRLMKDGVRDLGFEMNDTEVPIVTFGLNSAAAMQNLHQGLMDRGIYVYLSHYVGASQGGVLRHAVFANHTEEHIGRLLEALKELL